MKHESDVRQLFAAHGLTIHSIRRNGHWHVKASKNGGEARHFTVGTTYSDWRSMKNLIASLKRGRTYDVARCAA